MIDWFLFRTALKDLLRTRRLVPAALLVAAPAGIALLLHMARERIPPVVVYNSVASFLVFGFVLVILAVVFATGVISQEIEQKTIVYLLTRPVPRWRVVLGKFAAALVMVIATTGLSLALVAVVAYGGRGLGSTELWRDLRILPVGALAYGSIFLYLAAMFNRALLFGLLFAFGWETWVPDMPGSFQKLSVMTYLRTLAPHPMPESESVDINKILSVFTPETISSGYAWGALIGVIVVCLAAALIAFSRREYVPRDDAD